jgi:hypothetical protein
MTVDEHLKDPPAFTGFINKTQDYTTAPQVISSRVVGPLLIRHLSALFMEVLIVRMDTTYSQDSNFHVRC